MPLLVTRVGLGQTPRTESLPDILLDRLERLLHDPLDMVAHEPHRELGGETDR